MKKHLIAAAVAGAFAVPAMAQVTVSGSLNYEFQENTKVTNSVTGVSTKASRTGMLNRWTTNQVVISGTEDLGGGLKAGFTINSHVNNTAGLGSRDTNINLSGGFGMVRVGRFVPAAGNGYHGFSGAASTAVGSIYHINAASPDAARFGTFGAGNMERNDNQIQYTSPNISGLVVNVNYGTNSSDSNASTAPGETSATQTGVAISYAAGPLSVGAGMTNREAQGVFASPFGTTTGIVAASESVDKIEGKLTYFGASYNLGVASVAVTNVSRKDQTKPAVGATTTGVDLSVTSFGVSVPMGAMTLAASMYQGDNEVGAGAADNTELSGYQASLRYALSKRTTVYALIGENTIKRDGAASTATPRKETGNMFGVVHTF